MPDPSVDIARDLLSFIDSSPTPYHAVAEGARRLEAAGFSRMDMREPWAVESGLRGYVVHGGGSLIAFAMGSRPPEESGFLLMGAHTDSPNLRIKPESDIQSQGYAQLAVEVYGGVLWHTWLDRDLSIAGRISISGGRTVLIRFDQALLRIPSLAIHLSPEVNKNGLQLNAQQHLAPVLGLEQRNSGLAELLHAKLSDAGADPSGPVLGHDLCLYDTQPASFGGRDGELLFAPRLDNLASCHAGLTALLQAKREHPATRVVVLYDHEEVGSQSAAGARSSFLSSVLERLTQMTSSQDAYARALARSLLLSCDMAHAVHPNYAEKHDRQHRPKLARGPVIKRNANQSYATDGPGTALVVEACRAAKITPQHFVSRNDMGCGSTIGPISAARLGIRTVDIGNPMLSMHSCREMAATSDVAPMIAVLKYLFEEAELPEPSA